MNPDIWHEASLQGFGGTQSEGSILLSLCYISVLWYHVPHLLPTLPRWQHSTHNSTSIPLHPPPMSPIFNKMSHQCLMFNLDNAALLYLNSCALLCGITLCHFSVWVLHNAECTVGKQILTLDVSDNCSLKDCMCWLCFLLRFFIQQ